MTGPFRALRVGRALLVDDNTPARDLHRVRCVDVVGRAHPVVVDGRIAPVLVPDLDPELVDSATAVDVSVVRRQQEPVVSGPIDRARASVLSLVARDDEPLVDLAVEVEVPGC